MEKVKIMIVDDSRVSRVMLANELNRTNFEVVAQAKNAAEAVQLYEKHHPALVTMDMQPPHLRDRSGSEDCHDFGDEGREPHGARPRDRHQRIPAEAGQYE